MKTEWIGDVHIRMKGIGMGERVEMVRAGLDGGEKRKKVRRQGDMEERQTKV